MFMNTTIAGVTFTDYQITDTGDSIITLDHDWFTQQDLIIRTAAAGGGTLLTTPADYSLIQSSTELSAATAKTVYHQIQITNVTYQTGTLYFSGKFIADSIEASDVQYNEIKIISSTNYTIRDADGYDWIKVTTGNSDRTITLPTVADNENRRITISKIDNGTGAVIVSCEGAEKIDNESTLSLLNLSTITIRSDGAKWVSISSSLNNSLIKNVTSDDYIVLDGDNYGWIKVSSPLSSTNLIDRHDCESATPPALFSEVTNDLDFCTFAQSDERNANGQYSYKYTKTASSSMAYIQDSILTTDMHCFIAGRTYTLSAWLYVPSGQCLGIEAGLGISYYDNATWTSVETYATNTYDEWKLIAVTASIPLGATGVLVYFRMLDTATNGEYYFVDEIGLRDHCSTITLPTVANNTGREIMVSKEDATAGLVVIDGESAELINLWQTNTLSNQYDNILIRSNGTTWEILNGRTYPTENEPSLGSAHKHIATLTSSIPANDNVQTLSLVGVVPTGTKWASGRWELEGADTNRIRIWDATGMGCTAEMRVPVAGQAMFGMWEGEIDSNLDLRWAVVGNAGIIALSIVINRYWC
jgi:hypothetical protein